MGIYVLNTLLVPFLRAGLDLLVDGVADHETIDKVWRIFARAPEGPFQMIDFIGLNTAYNVSGIRRREGASHRPISQGELYRPRQARCLHRRGLLHVRRCELDQTFFAANQELTRRSCHDKIQPKRAGDITRVTVLGTGFFGLSDRLSDLPTGAST
jgi:hypothetical protein